MMLWSLYREPIGKRRDSCMDTIFEPPTLPFHSKLRITVRSQAYVLGLGLGLEGRGLGLGLEDRGLGLGLGLRILALTTSLVRCAHNIPIAKKWKEDKAGKAYLLVKRGCSIK